MTHLLLDQPALDYFPCRYGMSKQLFRGPRRRLEGDYAAFIGGTETYGKFMDMPFPTLVEVQAGLRSVNLGCVNAGLDAYLNDRCLLDICSGARLTVIQVIGAANLSNRFYCVHPRRNDRFLRAEPCLEQLFPEVDFTEVSFTGHMLAKLAGVSRERLAQVVAVLQDAWADRMQELLAKIDGPKLLLWLADHAPPATARLSPGARDPLFVTRDMLEALASDSDGMVEVVATREERETGVDEMYFAHDEGAAARAMLGPVVHRRVADTLAPLVKALQVPAR